MIIEFKRCVTDVFVIDTPALHGGREERVAEAEGGRNKRGRNGGVHFGVVSLPVAFAFQDQVELGHELFAQHHGQEFVVGDGLNQSGKNVPSFLKTN